MIDNFILGDNQFFGVNHHSRKTGESKARRFENPEEVVEVFRAARRAGAGGVMLSSHERTPAIIRAMLKDKDLRENFGVYPNVPYIMKYVQKVTRHGIIGAANETILGPAAMSNTLSVLRGGWGLLRKDFRRMMESALEVELSVYRGAKIRAVFLHNGIVDILLGLGMHDVFLYYDEFIRRRYMAVPGFGTLNLGRLAGALASCGLKNPLIMAPFNSAGFHMNPSRQDCEQSLEKNGITLLAMNILASGASRPREAFEYLGRFRNLKHVVVGASSQAHLSESYSLCKECLKI